MEKWTKLSVPLLRNFFSSLKFGFSWGKFWPLRTLWHNLHRFLDTLECRIENKNNNYLGKTVLKISSQKSIRRTSFVSRLCLKLWSFHGFIFIFLFFIICTFSKRSFVDSKTIFVTNLRQYFQNSFPYTIAFCFLL